MTTAEMVKVYVARLCAEAGCTPESVYNPKTGSWFFVRGSASVEVFMSSYETVYKTVRTFIRCFSPVFPLPVDAAGKMQLLDEAAQNNTNLMGVKLGTFPDKGYLYAIAERDIEGMDYNEFKSLVSDLGYWADSLDDMLAQRFGHTAALN